RINATAPEGFAWDYMAFIEGWNNRMHSAEGASENAYGTSVSSSAEISVDEESNIITFLFSGQSLGDPASLEGVQVYITTWDWDGVGGVYRPLNAEAEQWVMGGGADGDPLIMDDILIRSE